MVAAFLERLRRLPLGDWAEAGRQLEEIDSLDRLEASASGVGRDALGATVRVRLRQVVNEMPRVAAQTRHRVLDMAAVAQGFLHPADVARMKKVALAAALALVARRALGEEAFGRIYAPFAELIPAAELSADAPETGA